MTLRFALLGAGRIGQAHARAISGLDSAQLIAAADPVDDAAQALQARYGCAIRSIDTIAASDDVDAVAICTPTDTHADLIERFARAGKAVFCEKPIDLSVARVRDCLAVVAQSGTPLMVGFQRRFDPDFAALKQALDDGQIGDVEMVSLISRDPAPPPLDYIAHSGGIFRDMTIHDFDMARWLLGEEVETVFATASVLTDPEIGRHGDFDSANVILRTASGRQCTIGNSRRATYGYDQRIEVHGSAGLLAAGNHHRNRIEIAGAGGYTRPPLKTFFMDRYIDAYAAEIAHFVDSVRAGTPPVPDGNDGLRALLLAEAAIRSVETGAAVAVPDVAG